MPRAAAPPSTPRPSALPGLRACPLAQPRPRALACPVRAQQPCGDVCDGEEGQSPPRFCGTRSASAVFRTAGCHDAPSWSSRDGYTCSEYRQRGWCAADALLDPAQGGDAQHRPEDACCACGRGAPEAAAHRLRGAPSAPRRPGAGSAMLPALCAALAAAALALFAVVAPALRRRPSPQPQPAHGRASANDDDAPSAASFTGSRRGSFHW